MNYIVAGLLLIIWIIFTLALTMTIIGFFVVVDEDSSWSSIPKKLLEVFTNNKQLNFYQHLYQH